MTNSPTPSGPGHEGRPAPEGDGGRRNGHPEHNPAVPVAGSGESARLPGEWRAPRRDTNPGPAAAAGRDGANDPAAASGRVTGTGSISDTDTGTGTISDTGTGSISGTGTEEPFSPLAGGAVPGPASRADHTGGPNSPNRTGHLGESCDFGDRVRDDHSGHPAGTGPGLGTPARATAPPRPGGAPARPRTGVWLIGARGSVATTTVAGAAALAAGLHPPTGVVTETPPFAGSGLPPLDSLVFGGHDTAGCPLPKRAEALAEGGVLPHGLPAAVRAELAAADAAIRPGGPQPGDTRSDEELIADFAADISAFAEDHGLARAVVVNVASTEPAPGPGDDRLPPSSLYAAAALRAGCPYVNFTPSTGLHHPALAGLAAGSGLPYAGRDGKTGQTLLRSVLAPMFLQRALTVRAWSGSNLLGGGDGAALADPAAAAAKNAGKERVLADTLGTVPEGEVHIDDVPALGDWKTAWDHIAFDGFLGSRVILQTIWQGCDSALAAPLVLDLARLAAAAHAAGISGPVPGLGFYFKDPDDGPSGLSEQWRDLLSLAERLGAGA